MKACVVYHNQKNRVNEYPKGGACVSLVGAIQLDQLSPLPQGEG